MFVVLKFDHVSYLSLPFIQFVKLFYRVKISHYECNVQPWLVGNRSTWWNGCPKPYETISNKSRLPIACPSSALLSPQFLFSFYYYMHGEMSGSLTVLHREHSTGSETILWSKSGEQGTYWNRVQISVDRHSLYQVSPDPSNIEVLSVGTKHRWGWGFSALTKIRTWFPHVKCERW